MLEIKNCVIDARYIAEEYVKSSTMVKQDNFLFIIALFLDNDHLVQNNSADFGH